MAAPNDGFMRLEEGSPEYHASVAATLQAYLDGTADDPDCDAQRDRLLALDATINGQDPAAATEGQAQPAAQETQNDDLPDYYDDNEQLLAGFGHGAQPDVNEAEYLMDTYEADSGFKTSGITRSDSLPALENQNGSTDTIAPELLSQLLQENAAPENQFQEHVGPSNLEHVNLDYFEFPARDEQQQYMHYHGQQYGMGQNTATPTSSAYPAEVVPSIETDNTPVGNANIAGNNAQAPQATTAHQSAADNGKGERVVGLRFGSAQEANAFTSPQLKLPYDATIPRNDDAKKAIVLRLVAAFKSVDRAQDNKGMLQPFLSGKHDPIRVEAMCWNLLETSITRHTHGPLLASYKQKTRNSGMIPTFGERMEKMIDCLETHKTICKHLLDPMYMFSFIDDPIGSRSRVISNKSLNKRKGELMNRGKRSLRVHSRDNSNATNDEDEEEEIDEVHDLALPFDTPARRRSNSTAASTPFVPSTPQRPTTDFSSPYAHPMYGQQSTASPAMSAQFDSSPFAVPQSTQQPSNLRGFDIPVSNASSRVSRPAVGSRLPPPRFPIIGGGSNLARSASANAIIGMGRNMPAGSFNPDESRVYSFLNNGRGVVPNHLRPLPGVIGGQPSARPGAPPGWRLASALSTPQETNENEDAKEANTESAPRHGRKRSQDESEGSEYLPPPQKKR